MAQAYAGWDAVIKKVALRHEQTFRSLDTAVDIHFFVGDDEVWHSGGLKPLKQGTGVKIQRFSSFKRQYLKNSSRYGQSYY